ncbi:MAG: hypothetical protein WCH99_02915 [Verrucomicrobiota bacterium]
MKPENEVNRQCSKSAMGALNIEQPTVNGGALPRRRYGVVGDRGLKMILTTKKQRAQRRKLKAGSLERGADIKSKAKMLKR